MPHGILQKIQRQILKYRKFYSYIHAITHIQRTCQHWRQRWCIDTTTQRLYTKIRLINNISHDKTWTWLRKENFKRETDSPQIAAQDSALKINHIKARIDKTQQNSKCRLCGNRDETINHIISDCSKLAQREYKERHDWVGKVIHWEMCKKFKFDHTNKWYMHLS